LLLDYILHSDELDGLSFIKQLLSHNPNIKILLFSSMESLAVIRTAFMLGVRGYIAKRELPAVYLQAIRSVAYGHRHVPDEIALELAQVPARKRDAAIINGSEEACIASLTKLLTPREAEVIYSFLEGMSLTEIAAKLKRSRKTISGHKQSGMRKLGVSSDLELFKYRNDLFK